MRLIYHFVHNTQNLIKQYAVTSLLIQRNLCLLLAIQFFHCACPAENKPTKAIFIIFRVTEKFLSAMSDK